MFDLLQIVDEDYSMMLQQYRLTLMYWAQAGL